MRTSPEVSFGGFSEDDGTVRFYTRVNALLDPSFTVVDVGCGRGTQVGQLSGFKHQLRMLKGRCRRLIGIDVDEEAAGNGMIDEFRLIENGRWPLDDESVDLLVCDYVLEHVDDPKSFFRSCARVLRSGGVFCARTPEAWSYPAIAARCIPERWQPAILQRVHSRRVIEHDVYPTRFRCNTARRLRTQMRDAGFEPCIFRHDNVPSYLSFSNAAFELGKVVHRILPPSLKSNLFVFGRKEPVS